MAFNLKLSGDSGASSSSKSITFSGSEFELTVWRGGHVFKPKESKWYNKTNIRFLMLAFFEIGFYISLGKPIYSNWFISLGFLVFFLVVIFIIGHSKNLRMNHGAEHKVINAFLNRDLKNAEKYSRFSDDCGSNIYSILVILLAISPIVKLPVTIFTILLLIYDRITTVRMVAFKTVGKFVQRFTTMEPTEDIMKVAKDGFEKLIYAEIEKMIRDKIYKTGG